MFNETLILLIAIIATLVVIVAVLLWYNIHSQHEMRKKNEAIIREIRENMQLRDELQSRLRHGAVSSLPSLPFLLFPLSSFLSPLFIIS